MTTEQGAGPHRPWRGVPADDRVRGRRRRLLDAGLEHFGTTGYASTTVAAVCRTAGLSTRYFYESFRDKEDLLAAVFEVVTDEGLRAAQDALAGAPPEPVARLVAAVEAFLEHQTTDVRRLRVQMVESVGTGPRLARAGAEAQARFTALVLREHRAFGLTPDLDEPVRIAIADLLVGAVNGPLAAYALDPDPARLPALRSAIVAVYRVVLTADTTALGVPHMPPPS